MKIPMNSRFYMGVDRYIIEGRVNPSLSRKSRAINLVWDTGSSENTIGYKDALAMQVLTSKLESTRDFVRINLGEGPLKGYEVMVEYRFLTENNERIETEFPALVLCPWSNSSDHIGSAERAPSLIGKKFLEEKGWHPTPDWNYMKVPDE